jgi:hypothetical protein
MTVAARRCHFDKDRDDGVGGQDMESDAFKGSGGDHEDYALHDILASGKGTL